MKNLRTAVFALVFLTLLICGCSKVNRDNYDRVKVGMLYNEVIEIIGQPDRCDETLGMKNCIWGSDEKNITIKFASNKVVLPSMKGL